MKTQAEKLRKRINEPKPHLTAGIFDPFTAQIAESVGFGSLSLGGYSVGAALGVPEPLLTATHMCEKTFEISKNIDIPIVVDGGAGFGEPAHIHRNIQEIAKSGASGIHIEDQVYPKQFHYHAGIHQIVDVDTMVTRLQSALNARDDMEGDFVLIARSDAGLGDRREKHDETIEDAVNRVNRYLDVGAEVGMVFPSTFEELEYASDHIEKPFVFVQEEYLDLRPDKSDLQELDIQWCIYPVTLTLLTFDAMSSALEEILSNGDTPKSTEEYDGIRKEVESLLDLESYYQIEDK